MTSTIFEQLRQDLSLEHIDAQQVKITGNDPIYPTPFLIGEAAAAILALQGCVLDALRVKQGYKPQFIDINCSTAAISTEAVNFQRQAGYNWLYNDPDYPTVDFYRTADERIFFLHGGYPTLRDGILNVLDCPNNRVKKSASSK